LFQIPTKSILTRGNEIISQIRVLTQKSPGHVIDVNLTNRRIIISPRQDAKGYNEVKTG
jgi:hypothetical protein